MKVTIDTARLNTELVKSDAESTFAIKCPSLLGYLLNSLHVLLELIQKRQIYHFIAH